MKCTNKNAHCFVNPYESPTHCEAAEADPVDWSLVATICTVLALFPLFWVLALPVFVYDQWDGFRSLPAVISGVFWMSLLAIDVAFIWFLIGTAIIKCCN